MKGEYDIQRAHDILHAICLDEIDVGFDNASRVAVHAAHDCLGWMLGHLCGEAFAESLAKIEREALRRGYLLEEKP